ncbi:MAG: entericidin [Betaproteobacteria bacterium RIFCSPLOWO2_12_FULL_65_14]|nr:MAG: entericidin [Betaproteobacteria bacterium RIFCSPLOWO2_12_FULL_65_14]
MRKANMILLALVAAFMLSGCNTVEGVGKDLKQGGQAIERAAKK